MKVCLMVALCALFLAACGSSSPQAAVGHYLDHLAKKDAQGMNATLCDDSLLQVDDSQFANIRSLTFLNLSYRETEQNDQTQAVHVAGRLKMDAELNGQPTRTEANFSTSFILRQDGDSWCILEVGAIF